MSTVSEELPLKLFWHFGMPLSICTASPVSFWRHDHSLSETKKPDQKNRGPARQTRVICCLLLPPSGIFMAAVVNSGWMINDDSRNAAHSGYDYSLEWQPLKDNNRHYKRTAEPCTKWMCGIRLLCYRSQCEIKHLLWTTKLVSFITPCLFRSSAHPNAIRNRSNRADFPISIRSIVFFSFLYAAFPL